jgi:glycosyltransferase involved in cell wall biosynthesis
VVSTDCPSGPTEILEGGRFGKLVPVQDPVALSLAIVEVLKQNHDRVELTLRAKDFSVEKIATEYILYFSLKGSQIISPATMP